MIGSALKKLAKENQMFVDQGIAYGNFHGYAVSFHEGAGWKGIFISCLITDSQKEENLRNIMMSEDLKENFRVTEWMIEEKGISIYFHDNPGTMKKFHAFIDWFFPLLDESGATGVDICTQCGTSISDGEWYFIGDRAYHLHKSCGDHLVRQDDRKEELEKEEKSTSYLRGFGGAFIGALLGSIVWGVVYYLGYVASIVGILIGVLASKGYNLAGGKQTRIKNIILVIVAFFAVAIGMIGAYGFEMVTMISSGELEGAVMGDIPWMLLYMFMDTETLKLILLDLAQGMLFALLGLFVIMQKVHRENKSYRPKKLGK